MSRQRGAGLVVVLIVLVVLSLIGFVGWYVWRHQSVASGQANTNMATSQQSAGPQENNTIETLAHGNVTLDVVSAWKPATGGYFSVESGHCGQSVYATIKTTCIDHLMLIPSGETFTNPDQFHVDVSVFDRSDTGSAEQWLEGTGNANQTGGQMTTLQVHGQDIAKYSVDYGDSETRVYYGIVSSKYGVLISAYTFKGGYYSYKNTGDVDYRTYLPSIEMLAKSVEIKGN